MKNILLIILIITYQVLVVGQTVSDNESYKTINLGSFSNQINLIETLDLDADGDNDIITTKNDSTLLILENTGEMHFRNVHMIKLKHKIIDVFTHDYNDDGQLDIFINTDSETLCFIQIEHNLYEAISLFNEPIKLKLVDNELSNNHNLVFLENNSILKLSYPNLVDTILNASDYSTNIYNEKSLFFTDYDFDGDCDIVFCPVNNPGKNTIAIYRKETNTYIYDTLFHEQSNNTLIPNLFTDIDLDGDMDIIYEDVSYYQSHPDFTSSRHQIGVQYWDSDTVLVDTLLRSISFDNYDRFQPKFKIADINNDGLLDIVSFTHGDRFRLLFKLINTGSDFEYEEIDKYQHLASDNYFYKDVNILDINQNGQMDIVVATTRINGIFYLENGQKQIISQNTGFAAFHHLRDNYFAINIPYFRYEPWDGHILHVDTFGGVHFSKRNYNFSTFSNYDSNKGTTSQKLDLKNNGEVRLLIGDRYNNPSTLSYFNEDNNLVRDTTCLKNKRLFSLADKFVDLNFDNVLDIISKRRDSVFVQNVLNCDSIQPPQFLFVLDSVHISQIEPAQLNHEFYKDFIVYDKSENQIHFIEFINNSYIQTHTFQGKLKHIADVNNDGLDDIFTDDKLFVSSINGYQPQFYPNTNALFENVLDINNDNRLDLMMIDNQNQVQIYFSSPNTLFDSVLTLNETFDSVVYSKTFNMYDEGFDAFYIADLAPKTINSSHYSTHQTTNYLYINSKSKLYKTNTFGSDSEGGDNSGFQSDNAMFYPNPTQGIMTYSGNLYLKKVDVYDNIGKHIKTIVLNGSKTINISDLASGSYVLDVETKTTKSIQGIIIKL